MLICISVDNIPSDVITITINTEKDTIEQINEKVLSFVKETVCDVFTYQKIHSHSFKVFSIKGHEYLIDWRNVKLWTEEELNRLYF